MTWLGIDTSNYTTSAAVFDPAKGFVADERKLLPVKEGQLGLRQSDAVFHHTAALPGLISRAMEISGETPCCVAATVSPTQAPGSYMPCFSVGRGTAESIAAACRVPVKYFSHQASHIAAAVYSSGRTDLFEKEFIAFHVSGGTTEAVLVRPDAEKVFTCSVVASSLDLKAGQAIDRVGGMLGLAFPAGAAMDELARRSEARFNIKPFMRGGCPSMSGVQNRCEQMLASGADARDIAFYCVSYIIAAVDGMTAELEKKYPGLPFVYSGGVMSNSMARETLPARHDAVFSAKGYSSDNACGTAVLAYLSDCL